MPEITKTEAICKILLHVILVFALIWPLTGNFTFRLVAGAMESFSMRVLNMKFYFKPSMFAEPDKHKVLRNAKDCSKQAPVKGRSVERANEDANRNSDDRDETAV